jgi:hypothetical protein
MPSHDRNEASATQSRSRRLSCDRVESGRPRGSITPRTGVAGVNALVKGSRPPSRRRSSCQRNRKDRREVFHLWRPGWPMRAPQADGATATCRRKFGAVGREARSIGAVRKVVSVRPPVLTSESGSRTGNERGIGNASALRRGLGARRRPRGTYRAGPGRNAACCCGRRPARRRRRRRRADIRCRRRLHRARRRADRRPAGPRREERFS